MARPRDGLRNAATLRFIRSPSPGLRSPWRGHGVGIITHGHIDHMLSVTPVCGAHDIPAYVHPDDRYMLTEPLRGSVFPGMTERELAAMVGQKIHRTLGRAQTQGWPGARP